MSVLLAPLLLLLAAGGCMDLRPQVEAGLPSDFPERFSLYGPKNISDTPWWHDFASPELNRLQAMGLTENPDLQIAWARMHQSMAVADRTGAALVPDLSGAATGATLRSRNADGGKSAYDDFFLGLNTSWEMDLWGRVRGESESAVFSARATEEDARAAALSLSGLIAETWVNLLNNRQKATQLEEQLAIHRKLLELIEMRFMMAKAGSLDVYQQRQTVKAIEGGLITVRAQAQLALQQLALLTGRATTGELKLKQSRFPEIPPVPATGLPADLLAARPDIRAAGLRLQSSTWSVAAARADRLPRLQLDASLNYSAGVLDALLDTWLLRLAANLSGPIFDGGRRSAEVDRTLAVVDEHLAAYRKVVLTAIREVEDALTREQQFRRTIRNIDQQIEITENAYREATWRYLNGISDFLAVLREQVNLINLQLDRIQAGSNLLKARINLHRALGGNWLTVLTPPEKFASKPAHGVPPMKGKKPHSATSPHPEAGMTKRTNATWKPFDLKPETRHTP